MADCVFCKIINSEIPAHMLYEDANFIAILDRFPACDGHTLIIPKKHIENIYDLDCETAGQIFKLTTRIAATLKQALSPEGLNVVQNNGASAGQSVGHFHIHLLPRFKGDEILIKYEPRDPSNEYFQGLLKKICVI